MKIRALVVDDEPLARRRLRRMLAEHPSVEVIGEAADATSAKQAIDAERPDVVFLDIQMPGGSGLDLLAGLSGRPRVIFVTAHDEFAVRAFDEQAVDYLLKPVEPERLARAIARVTEAPQPSGHDPRVDRLLEAFADARPGLRRIPVRRGAKIILVDVGVAAFFRAEDKYTILYTADTEHVIDRTIDDLERTLDPASFLRIHRSTLVNVNFVRELTSIEGGRYVVAINDPRGSRLHASRAGARLLKQKLGI